MRFTSMRWMATLVLILACASRAAAQVPPAPRAGTTEAKREEAKPGEAKTPDANTTAVKKDADGTGKGCVGELVELKPEPIRPEERVIEQEEACVKILQKKGTPANNCPGYREAVDFCSDPLAAAAVTGADLLRARSYADQEGCTKGILPSGDNVTTQSFVPLSLQDEILRGLAQFVVARAKAEAMAFLIGVLKDKVCKQPDARDLAVHTCDVLESSDPSNGTPPAWGTIKAAFEADVEVLPERAVACAAHGASPQVRDLLVTGVQAAMLVRRGDDPVEVLGGLVNRFPFTSTKCTAGDLDCGLHMLGFAVRLLAPSKNPDDETAPRAPRDRLLFAEIAARRLVDEAVSGGIFTGKPAAGEWAVLRERLGRLESRISSLVQAVQIARASLKQVSATNINLQSGLRLAHTIVDVIDAAIDLVPAHYFGAHAAVVHKYLAVVDELAAAVDAAFTRDFAATFVHVASSLATTASTTRSNNDPARAPAGDPPQPVARVADAASAPAMAPTPARPADAPLATSPAGPGASAPARLLARLPDAWLKYGPFIAEIAAAKSADDVQHALESAAAPVGAGLAKRGSGRSTIAITAFLGGHAGKEFTSVSNGNTVSGWQGSLFAPVGIDVSWGLGELHSLGLFFSVIDLGALTSIRTSDDVPAGGNIMAGSKVEAAPQVGFRQVVAPGAYFVWGIDRAAIGVGASVTPELREISHDGMLLERDAAVRFGAFLAIDVTLFPF